jgi:F-type H+-transporting ATPase subunit a
MAVSLGCATCALAAEAGDADHPHTWLDWLLSLQIAGRPLIRTEAGLAFAWSVVAVGILTLIAVLGTRRLSMKSRGLQTLLEMAVGGIRSMVVDRMGPRGAEFVPFIGTLFIYIAVMNLMGLVPGFMPPTANLSITAALAIIVFVVVQSRGLKEQGVGYAKHFVEGLPLQFPYVLLAPLIFAIHLVGELFRPVTLALRLFGNIMAGERVLLVLIGMGVGLLPTLKIPLPLQLFNMMLEVLVAVVQATVFSLLATVYLAGVLHEPEAEGQTT